MLRIAVPNKGMLSEPAWNMLAEAGYRLRTNPRQLVVQDEDNGIELCSTCVRWISRCTWVAVPLTWASPDRIC